MGARNWEPYLLALKDGPHRLDEVVERVFGQTTDRGILESYRKSARMTLARMTEKGLVDRPAYGRYALPGTAARYGTATEIHAWLRTRPNGALCSDVQIEFGMSVSAAKHRLQALVRAGLVRSTFEQDAVYRRARLVRYAWASGDARAAPPARFPNRYRSTGDPIPDAVLIELGVALRGLEENAFKRAGLAGWLPTLSFRHPRTGARYVLTRDPQDPAAPAPPPAQADPTARKRGNPGDQHWTRRFPEKLKAARAKGARSTANFCRGDDHWTRRDPERARQQAAAMTAAKRAKAS